MRIRLVKSAGPECPNCGCNGARLVGNGRRGTYLWSIFDCEHCDHEFTINGRLERLPEPIACKHCGSKNTVATSTPGRIQYRHCRDCERPFSDAK